MASSGSTTGLFIDRPLLQQLSATAVSRDRLRANHNFHTPEEEVANRLLNAVEPGSYIQPHRHAQASKDESILVVAGSFGFVFFDETGTVIDTVRASPGGEVIGVNIPHGTFHSVVALESGSVFFEAKAGPYEPLTEGERAPWAPSEGEPEADAYRAMLEGLFT
jgi:cupin fold WbuC family metalloprotein